MTVKEQLNCFKNGFPWLEIAAPATVGRGIKRLSEQEMKEAADYYAAAEINGVCKFIPASGAASRMFKNVFARDRQTIKDLADNIEKFAFYDKKIFGNAPYNPEFCAKTLLDEPGLAYGNKPKGVLAFHRYPDGEIRTALAEHLVEGQRYARNEDGTVRITFTISPEHQSLFENALAQIKDKFEKRYGVRYIIDFTYQDKDTDTIAVNPDNTPFTLEDGSTLKRPAGHGALIKNLQAVDSELVFIKNIDNVANERLLEITATYKTILAGRALMARDKIFGYIYEFDQLTGLQHGMDIVNPYIPAYSSLRVYPFSTDECQQLCNKIENFLVEELCIEMPEFDNCTERALTLRRILDRPIRVCGMVLNTGEPGGGPYFTRNNDGSTSLQILEAAQINPENPAAAAMMSKSTHFNPVDLVCCLRNCRGEKFELEKHVDMNTCFISSKSYNGRPLKALELPGLWNGSMSDWNTIFIEVPIETFNPVKVVLDLLRPNHQ